ncbi:MAG: hypothetical protein COA52_16325 [Hyphomicrobiales bacterium]|nr:MAG: hypothetical protein COA52_16325 [Hyphomicrobiales bacterium]
MNKATEKPKDKPKRRFGIGLRLRNYFLTGLVIAAPISLTIYLIWNFILWIDGWVKPLIPAIYNPDTYLPFSVPGGGLLFAFLSITLLGFFTAGIVGKTIVAYGESLLGRMPFVRNLYQGLKQIFETVLSDSSKSFQHAALLEYPRRGLWAMVFISTETKGEVKNRLEKLEDDMISIFLPTTPNPTSGFLLFVPAKDLILLNMTVEQAAKLVISAGLVVPDIGSTAGLGDNPDNVTIVKADSGEQAKKLMERAASKQEPAE